MKPVLLDARGRTAFVTGAAGGIGRATVALLRSAGAKVAVFDRGARGLAAPAPAVLRFTGEATDERALREALAATRKRFGRIDYLVSATGAVGAGGIERTSLADWREMLETNLTSAFLLCREADRHLARPGASVVLFSSTNGRNGGNRLSGPGYAAAKAGIINLTRHLARDWAGRGVRVNCIAPGPVATPMLGRLTAAEHRALRAAIPLGRYAEAREVAGQVAFLCSPWAASITGTCLNVSGGMLLD